jgi:hypothetical protein
MQMGINSCKYLHELQKDALKRVYIRKTPDDGEDDDEDDDDDDFDDDLEADLGESALMEDE